MPGGGWRPLEPAPARSLHPGHRKQPRRSMSVQRRGLDAIDLDGGWRMSDVGMPYLKATADGGKPLLTAFCELLTLTQRFGESRRQSTSFPPSAISHPPSELQ